MRDVIESGLEKSIFASRWFLAPMYIGLMVGLGVISVKFLAELWNLLSSFTLEAKAEDVTVSILSLIDIALLGNLMLIVIFAGYENFVSKIKVSEDSEDRPAWMGSVDFSGLKMKLIGSLVAISVILLLKDFVAANDPNKPLDYTAVGWRIALHVTFVVSGVLFSVMDYWAAKRLIVLADLKARNKELGDPQWNLH